MSKFQPKEMKRCQRCKKERPASDFEMGEQRPKRVCNPCEKVDASAPAKPMGRPRKSAPETAPIAEAAPLTQDRAPRVAPPKRKPSSADPEMVHSKPMRCPKCQLGSRFERRSDATPDDFWTCLESNCQLRIGNYNIAVSKDYRGGGSAS